MLKNILTVLRKLASAAMNFLIVYFETIAVPMSWAMGGTIMFTMYTELSNIFNGAVCLLVGLWQLSCIFTGRELPLWLKRLKFISTSCLAMTFLTVVIILAPMYEDGNGWYIMLFTGSMLYHHFLDPVLAILSLVLFERLPRLPLGRSGGRWCRRSYTVCMICTAILQEPSMAPTPSCGYTTRPFRRR